MNRLAKMVRGIANRLMKIVLGINLGMLGIVIIAVIGLVGTITITAVVSLITAIPTYFLWNWLMPALFGVKAITFWQAWGINFLAGILFKNSSSSSSKNSN